MGAIEYLVLLSWSVVLFTNAAYDSNQDYYYYNDDADHCTIELDYKSPYVTALNERLDVVGGCLSQETTSDDREVHVINILQNSRRRGRENFPTESAVAAEVTLKLSPRKIGPQIVEHSRKLLFVLNSEQPVIWNIQKDHMSNTTRHLFWISRNSRLHKDGLELKIKIKKKEMPHQTSELVHWIRNQSEASALTSYAEVQQAVINTIDFKVGIDPSLPETCSDNYNPRPDVTASSLHKQKTNACVAVSNEGYHNQDVHIIEVHTSKNSPTKMTDIVLDIKAYEKQRRNRHLILVLKSHSDVKWKIHTKGIRGVVEIIADDQVDTNSVEVHSVSVARERLTNIDRDNLITWTRERYGPAVSYTEATEANKFLLYIDGAAHAPKDSFEEEQFADAKQSPFEVPARTRKAIKVSQTVNCRNEVLVVALRKHILHRIGVYKQHLSLLDETCMPRDNATHYIFESKLNHCGTTTKKNNGDIVYENAIVLHKLSPDTPVDNEEFSGSGSDIVPPDSTHLDDEDFTVETDVDMIRSDFKCHKNANSQVLNSEYSLSLYKDKNFDGVSPVEFPFSIDSNATVYLEAAVRTEPGLEIVVHNCYMTTHGSEDITFLIYNGCTQKGVTKLKNTEGNVQRFTILFSQYAERKTSRRNILCLLGICQSGQLVSQSVDQCSAVQNCLVSESSLTDRKTEMVGPLLVEGKPQPADADLTGMNSGDIKVTEEEVEGQSDTKPCSQQQGPPGLDSTTVVVIAFAAFIIGVLLVLALWLIYAKTVPQAPRFLSRHNPQYLAAKNSNQRARFAETSGESTPSSTAPITIHQVNHH